jgi:hypothetical protein
MKRKGMKGLATDHDGFMLNLSIIFMLGYALVALSVLAFTFHGMGWADNGFLQDLWNYAPFVCGFGVMVVASKINDPRIVIGLGVMGVIVYTLLFRVMLA